MTDASYCSSVIPLLIALYLFHIGYYFLALYPMRTSIIFYANVNVSVTTTAVHDVLLAAELAQPRAEMLAERFVQQAVYYWVRDMAEYVEIPKNQQLIVQLCPRSFVV